MKVSKIMEAIDASFFGNGAEFLMSGLEHNAECLMLNVKWWSLFYMLVRG
jgi:hypothetical protein